MPSTIQYRFIDIVAVIVLVTACEVTSPKSGQAKINQLALTLKGKDYTVTFNNNRQGTITHKYPNGEHKPGSVVVKSIAVSDKATASVSNGQTIKIDNNTVTITVTAENKTKQIYNVTFIFEEQADNTSAINQLVLTLKGQDYIVKFNSNRRDTITYRYSSGGHKPDSVMVKNIAVSDKATASVSNGQTIKIDNNTITITVTAENKTTQIYNVTFIFEEQSENTAVINQLVLTLKGQDYIVKFNSDRRDTITYRYSSGGHKPDSVMVKNIAVSDKATASVSNGQTIKVDNNTVTITVTAENKTTQIYNVTFIFEEQRDNAKSITALTIVIVGEEKTITFNTQGEASASYAIFPGESPPTIFTIKNIAVSDKATASVSDGQTIKIDNNTITVTSEDNTKKTYSIAFQFPRVSPLENLRGVITGGTVPTNLSTYSEPAKAVLAPYPATATVAARFITIHGSGTQDGSSWTNAIPATRLTNTLDSINDATANKIYLVLVAGGTYAAGKTINMKKHVAIVGGWATAGGWGRADTDTTVFSGDNKHTVVKNRYTDSTALIYGATINKGYNNYIAAGMNNYRSSPTVTNMVFSENNAPEGAAMYNNRSSPLITHVTFKNNTSKNNEGAGILNTGGSPVLNNVIFVDNKGCGMDVRGGAPILNNVIFINNFGEYGGGMKNRSQTTPILTNVTFQNNIARNSGGGMYNGQSAPTLNNVTFIGNQAVWGNGGGIYNLQSSPTLNNVTFIRNRAAKNGGGIYNSYVAKPILTNVTITNNSAGHHGGGIFTDYTVYVINSILWGNQAGKKGSQMALEYPAVNVYGKPNNIIIAHSIIDTSGMGIDTLVVDKENVKIDISYTRAVYTNPRFGTLAKHGGNVPTLSIQADSPARNIGLYIRFAKNSIDYSYYYSNDNINWFTDPGLTTAGEPPDNAKYLTSTTDATGTTRTGRPDAGAYEVR